jgi:GABA(A) receptor-associated protein
MFKKLYSRNIAFNYKKEFDYDKRLHEATSIIDKYPDRVPIIVEENPSDIDKLQLDKHKYLVPVDLTVGQFVYVIRKRLSLDPTCALFLFINNNISCTSDTIGSIYDRQKDSDKFLYITISLENTFG